MRETHTRAIVFFKDKPAGVLTKGNGVYQFVYTPPYLADPSAQPISLSLPLRTEPYESEKLFPFFDGLLPEGWLLDLISASAKIDKNDKFQMLLQTGRDPVGAVSVRPFEEPKGA